MAEGAHLPSSSRGTEWAPPLDVLERRPRPAGRLIPAESFRERSARRAGRSEVLFAPQPVIRARLRPGVVLRRSRYEVAKRALDLTATLLAMPFVLPLLLACSLAILLKDGRPILFAQERTGRAGRRFKLYKLRTMVKDAAARKQELLAENHQSGPDFKVARDPRITPLGAFLRKYSLDELPQLLNVLKGDMSLVGPRPTSFAASTYDLWHTERLEIAPGLTGLWQVSGRADVDFDDRVRLDVEYVERRSLLFDLWILVRTVKEVVRPRGAY